MKVMKRGREREQEQKKTMNVMRKKQKKGVKS